MARIGSLDVAAKSDSGDADLLSFLGPSISKRAQQAIAAYAIGRTLYRSAKNLHSNYKARHIYTISLSSDDDLWNDVHRWLLEILPPEDQMALEAYSHREDADYGRKKSDESEPLEYSGSSRTRKNRPGTVSLLYDGTRSHTANIGGYEIEVLLTKPEQAPPSTSGELSKWLRKQERITFHASSVDARDAVRDFLKEIAVKHFSEDKNPRFFMLTRWGSWNRRDDIPLRPLNSVILRDGQLERIVDDLQGFLNDASKYVKLGLPYHRGYLFHGCPGSGKTSLAKALSEHFGLDVWYIPLSDLDADANLLGLVADVSPGSILLLEDIDIASATKERTDVAGKITMSGLLNALDGFSTPQGLIVIMTTNHLDVLDPAMIREGRVDVLEEIGHLDQSQLYGLFKMVYGEDIPELPELPSGVPVSPAEIVGIIKSNFDTPLDAVQSVKELFASKEAQDAQANF